VVSLISTGVYAQTFDVSETTAVTGTTSHPTTVTFTQGATQTTSFDFALNYDPALLTFVSASSNQPSAGIACSDPAPPGAVLCFADAGGAAIPLNAIPSPTVITILFNVTGPAGTTALLTLVPGSITDVNGGSQTASPGSDLVGQVTITPAPVAQAPTLTFTPPAPGPIALTSGGTGSIAVTASTGSAGTSTTLACTPSAGFTATPVPASYPEAGGSGSVNLTCTPNVSGVQNGTVSCDPNQSAGTNQPAQVFNVTCPAAPALQPEFNAPLSLALSGGPASPATGTITVQNTGQGTLTITCGAPTGGFTVTQAPAATVAANSSTTIGIGCTTPGAAGATTNGTLACTTNDLDEGAVTFALSCTAQILTVPALGNAAKGLLVALLAGLGLLGFAMRRRVSL
jgi:hypothetical protein